MSHSDIQLSVFVAAAVAGSLAIYFGFRTVAPAAARASLSIGGAIGGSVLLSDLFLFVVRLYWQGWNGFGLFVLGFPVFFVTGAICGALLPLRLTSRSRKARWKLGIALCLTPLLAVALLFVLPQVIIAAIQDTRGDTMHERSISIYGFTASPQSAAFIIPTRDDANIRAFVFVDRATRQAWRLAEPDFSYRDPRLSWDGERLLLVRRKKGNQQRELLSCGVKSWRCSLIVRTEQDLVSPVEIDKDVVLYSSGPIATVDGKRYAHHDFYVVKLGSEPTKLTDFGLLGLSNINVYDGSIIFAASTPKRHGEFIAENRNALTDPRSDIFEWRIDPITFQIPKPPSPLQPSSYAAGASSNPAVSEDGRKLAFLNTELGKGAYRYNIMAVDRETRAKKLINLEGKNFSHAAFARNEMLYNELLDDRYRIRAWNWQTGTTQEVFEIEFDQLEQLPHISLSIGQNSSAGEQ